MNRSSESDRAAADRAATPGASAPDTAHTPAEYPDVGDVSDEAAEEDEVRAALGIVGAATPDAPDAER